MNMAALLSVQFLHYSGLFLSALNILSKDSLLSNVFYQFFLYHVSPAFGSHIYGLKKKERT